MDAGCANQDAACVWERPHEDATPGNPRLAEDAELVLSAPREEATD